MDNLWTGAGNVTSDPEIRFTVSGVPVCSFDIAINRRWTDLNTNQTREDTTYMSVQTWRALAENCAETIKKGQRVTINGRIELNTWEADDGTRRSKHRVVAQDVGVSLMWGKAEFTKVDRRPGANTAPTNPQPAAVAAGTGEGEGGEEPF